MTEPQQHCEHERICKLFIEGSEVALKDGYPCMANHTGCKPCYYDTRSRPARPIALSDLLRNQGIGPAPTLAPKEKHVAAAKVTINPVVINDTYRESPFKTAAPSQKPTDATGFWLTPKEMKQHDATIRNEILVSLERDFKGRKVEDAVAEIRRFPESLRTEAPK